MKNEKKQNKSASEIRAIRQARIAKINRINRAQEMQRLAEASRKAESDETIIKNPVLKEPVLKEPVLKETSARRNGSKRIGRQPVARRSKESGLEKNSTFEIPTPLVDHAKPATGWALEYDLLRNQEWLEGNTGHIKLTPELQNMGWKQISQARSLNTPIQIESPEGARFWIKHEQSYDAASAETEISAFYKFIGWPGCNLALTGFATKVVITPALGGPNIIDLGPIGDLFPMESEANGILAERSFVLSKLHLTDLRLMYNRDVVSFLIYNSIFANTDRHMMNLHLGSLMDSKGNSKGNVLLPIDHGMCLKANGIWDKHFMPEHTPLDVVTGAVIGYHARNPHQLLRPFVEFAEIYPDDIELIMELALSNVESFINYGALANGILLDHWAINYMKDNIDWLRVHKRDFISGCQNVVLTEEVAS